MIDLHSHTKESDGSKSVRELIDFAVSQNITVLAKCDHDTTAGNVEAVEYGREKELKVIPGLEVSATRDKGTCHILALNIKKRYEPLEEVLQAVRDSRDSRNEKIIGKLNENGIDITLEEVEKLAGGEVIARPHMARIMMSKGSVTSVQEAFDVYLAKGARAYVDRYRLDPDKAVKLISDSGAYPVLAHPTQLKLDNEQLEQFVRDMVEQGLKGIEVYNPYASDEEVLFFEKLADIYGLYKTGGSDYHGESKPEHYLGYYRKNRKNSPVPESCADIFR